MFFEINNRIIQYSLSKVQQNEIPDLKLDINVLTLQNNNDIFLKLFE